MKFHGHYSVGLGPWGFKEGIIYPGERCSIEDRCFLVDWKLRGQRYVRHGG